METFVGFAGGSTTFQNSVAAFDGDTIANFFAHGSQIDFTDFDFGMQQPLAFDGNTLQVNDGQQLASISLPGMVPPGIFVTHSDGGGGTLIGFQHSA